MDKNKLCSMIAHRPRELRTANSYYFSVSGKKCVLGAALFAIGVPLKQLSEMNDQKAEEILRLREHPRVVYGALRNTSDAEWRAAVERLRKILPDNMPMFSQTRTQEETQHRPKARARADA